jgi:hypothetical protein
MACRLCLDYWGTTTCVVSSRPACTELRRNLYKSDDERELAPRKLLENGNLKTGKDFEEAAVVFQPKGSQASHAVILIRPFRAAPTFAHRDSSLPA